MSEQPSQLPTNNIPKPSQEKKGIQLKGRKTGIIIQYANSIPNNVPNKKKYTKSDIRKFIQPLTQKEKNFRNNPFRKQGMKHQMEEKEKIHQKIKK